MGTMRPERGLSFQPQASQVGCSSQRLAGSPGLLLALGPADESAWRPRGGPSLRSPQRPVSPVSLPFTSRPSSRAQQGHPSLTSSPKRPHHPPALGQRLRRAPLSKENSTMNSQLPGCRHLPAPPAPHIHTRLSPSFSWF